MLKRQRERETSAQYKRSTREGRRTQRRAESKDKPRRSSFFS
jgi:hypothetical protein